MTKKPDTNGTVLIIEDTAENRNLMLEALEPEGYELLLAPNGEVGLKILGRTRPDLILLDVRMPGIDGFEVCRQIKTDKALVDIPIIFVTALHETESIVSGFHIGGVDYITKPFRQEEIRARVKTHLSVSRLTAALKEKNAELAQMNQELRAEITRRERAEDALQVADEQLSFISQQEAERWGIAGFVAQSQTMVAMMKDVRRLQDVDASGVLITGESGVGKELIARAIHFGSARTKAPFIPINCSAIPSELAESLLFGHVRGAFTGANSDRRGYFELADKGTLFLDELGEMPRPLQAKLLRVLEDGHIMPVGGTRPKPVNVRVVAATNADLVAQMANGEFREDLYYRLARYVIAVPALRERQEDIPLLASHFLTMFATEMGLKQPPFSHEALEALKSYSFPGNVRELKNIIERALIESGGATILPKHLHFGPPRPPADPPIVPTSPLPSDLTTTVDELPLNLRDAESCLIQRVLTKVDGNISKAARLLGVGRRTLYRKIEEHRLEQKL